MSTVPPYIEHRSLKPSILRPKLSHAGYIKVGGMAAGAPRWGAKGPFLPPTRYIDPVRFEVTTLERQIEQLTRPGGKDKKVYTLNRGYPRNEALHKTIGATPNRLSIRLIFPKPEDNLITQLAYFDGQRYACTGDGEKATEITKIGTRKEVSCPCSRLKLPEAQSADLPTRGAGVCKPRAILTVWLEASRQWPLLHMFKTTSWESIAKIRTQLDLIYQQFGTVAWLPLVLRVDPSHKTFVDTKGVRKRSIQPAVTIAIKGNPQDAMKAGQEWHQARDEARALYQPEEHVKLVAAQMESEAEQEGDEFFPEASDA